MVALNETSGELLPESPAVDQPPAPYEPLHSFLPASAPVPPPAPPPWPGADAPPAQLADLAAQLAAMRALFERQFGVLPVPEEPPPPPEPPSLEVHESRLGRLEARLNLLLDHLPVHVAVR